MLGPSGSKALRDQYLPNSAELLTSSGEMTDPIGDNKHSPVKGLVHRYPDRVLLKPLHTCPVYCRFCFRREIVGHSADTLSQAELEVAYQYIRSDSRIWEVIVTGGDPLILSPRRLRDLIATLDSIDHVKVIRFHTRVPVAKPSAVTNELVGSLQAETAVYVAIHANHPDEFTPDARAAIKKLARSGIALLSQTVLLKDINDDAITMENLMRCFTENRIKPYYLHHADLAPGTKHFRTSIETGVNLTRHLRGRVSGLCQPGYVVDIPGGFGKVPIDSGLVRQLPTEDMWELSDYMGGIHFYRESYD